MTAFPRASLPWQAVRWGGIAFLLMLPLAAMQVTDEVDWNAFDFLVAGLLLGGTGLAFEVALRQSTDRFYRMGAAIGLFTGLFLIWANLAVGVIGDESNPANLMYLGVLAIAAGGSVAARLRPRGMAWAMAAAAAGHGVVTIIVLVAGLGFTLGLDAVFAALWLLSAWAFRMAARA